jgi:hypothetical protein
MRSLAAKTVFQIGFSMVFVALSLATSCKKRCWQCVRPDSGEPIFAELCNDAPDYNRQALDNYKYACSTVQGVVKELH